MGRGRFLRALLVVALAAMTASGAAADDKPKPPAGIERSPEFIAAVNAAIDKGVAWLRTLEGGDSFAKTEWPGYEGGVPAFVVYTLRACGVARDEPFITKALDKLRALYYSQKERGECRTYTVALMCMAAAEEDPPPPRLASKSDTTDGDARGPIRLPKRDIEWLQDMARWLERGQNSDGGWTYSHPAGGYDQSNTQFALLGLRAAARGGAEVDSKTWTRALEHYLELQEPEGAEVLRFVPSPPRASGVRGATTDGGAAPGHILDHARGWGYREGEPTIGSHSAPYGSMTASGVAAVAICRDQLDARNRLPGWLAKQAERSIADGIAWLGQHFLVTSNPGPGRGPGWSTVYYHLYSLERAGMLAPIDWMGEHDWYGEGARHLLAEQKESGEWMLNRRDAVLCTCCALLFLKRGTVRHPVSAITPSAGEAPINVAAVRALGDREFDEFVGQMLSRVRVTNDAAARERLLAEITKVGPRLLGPLVLRLSSSLAAEREAAFALLHHATGLDHGYTPGAPADATEASVTRWQMWLITHEKELRYDDQSRRIVAK